MSQVARNLLLAACIAVTIGWSQADLIAQAKESSAPAANVPPPSENARAITDEDIQMLRKDIRAQRKDLVAVNMKLTPEEAEKFWPVYDQYVAELVNNNNKKYALIKQYVQSGGALSDAESEKAVQQWVDVDESVALLRRKYIPSFRKVLSPKNTALFYQLDRRVQLLIDLQLASSLPLIQP